MMNLLTTKTTFLRHEAGEKNRVRENKGIIGRGR